MAEEYATKEDIPRVLDRIDQVAERRLGRLSKVKLELIERDEAVVTKRLKEFNKWAVSFESKFKAIKSLVVHSSERVTSLEERVNDLECRD